MSYSLWPHGLSHQASLTFTISWSLLKFMSIGLVMLSNHLILCCPLLLFIHSFPALGSFPMSQLFTLGGQSIGASAPVLLMNIQSWFPLVLTGLISLQSKKHSRVFSSTTIQRHHTSSGLTLLCGPTLTSVHDYWKNHSFDYRDLCWQSDVSAF